MNELIQNLPKKLREKLANVQVLALDVDGILTEGSVTYDSQGGERKNFNIKDGLGIKLLQKANVEVAIITGRISPMVEKRANELNISSVIQGREDKGTALRELADELKVELDKIAYMGDDLPDYQAMNSAGVSATVSDGHAEVKSIADWISSYPGGKGAVREFCDLILSSKGQYQAVTAEFK